MTRLVVRAVCCAYLGAIAIGAALLWLVAREELEKESR